DDLDVEDDEEHRRQVEADREALTGGRPGRDARLERDHPGACPGLRPGAEDEGHADHRERDREREQPVHQERQPAVEHAPLPSSVALAGGPYQWTRRWHEGTVKPWNEGTSRCYKVTPF